MMKTTMMRAGQLAAGLLFCTAGIATPANAQTTAAVSRQPDRSVRELAQGWRFAFGAPATGPERVDFADDAWAPVSVPHSWNLVGYYLSDPASHLNRAETIDRRQGIGWYRLRFTPDAATRGKRVWLEFDAASRIASVWLNGVLLGEHKGGFSRFRFDATAAIRAGQANILAVRVDNSEPTPGSTTADVLPLKGDFFVHGGLYRPVRMVVTDPVHIDMRDSGGSGVFAVTDRIAAGTADVEVRTRISNDAAGGAAVTLVTRLLDAQGQVAAEATQRSRIATGATAEIAQRLTVRDAHLWQGVADPYLYRLVTEVRDGSGRTLDRIEQPYGIRQMRFDAASGFTLNGKPLRLHGVGMHQDREGKGWAVTPVEIESDVAMLRDMGANTIRLTHYQHGQTIHDLADRYGLILWDEIPLVSAWTQGDSKQASPALLANARQQLIELIRQNGNHASVATWGIANEVDFGDSLPMFLTGGGKGPPPDPMALLHELNALAKSQDPSRPTALATCCEGGVFKPGVTVPVTAPAADLGGANRYFGWYVGKVDGVGPALDALHAKRPDQPLSVTEYGAGGATTIHTDNVLGGPVDARGRNQPEEYESYVHEENWRALADRPWLWATWLWNAFDFASTIRTEGDARDINTKGLVTFDRAIRKDPFYFYRANWSPAPTVHVNGRRHVGRAYSVTDVRVYSNAPRTELIVNGRSVGTIADCPMRVCVWTDVRLKPGENRVAARGLFPAGPVEDAVAWRLADDAARAIRIDSGALVAGDSAMRYGSDTFFVGGVAGTTDMPAGYGRPPTPAPITGTPDRMIAATYREGDFHYRIPLDKGRYEVALTFVEPSAKPGERVFDVLVGGRTIVPALDIAGSVPAPLAALRRTATVTVTGDVLDLHFRPIKGKAIVSAVDVRRIDR